MQPSRIRITSDGLRSPSARCAKLSLAALVLFSMSCAVAPVAPPIAPRAVALAAKPAPNDPSVAAVRARLVQYQASTGLTDAEATQLAETIVVESRRHHFDPSLVLAVIHVESRFDTYAVSPKDALGLMQLLPSTGEALAPVVGVEWHGPQTLFDPVANVRLGVFYLRQLTDRYNGSVRTALVAYNWGPGRIDQFVRAGEALPREYSQLVLAAYDRS
jgi:soluble lytic murein transglycosylase-like protein